MRERRLLSSHGGLNTWQVPNNDGLILIEYEQDVEPALEWARQLRNLDDRGYGTASRELRRVAFVPNIVITKWLAEEGLNIFDPDHEARYRKKLNDPDWAYLRTGPGRV